MTFDPRGFEKAMKDAVCPHYGDDAVCGTCMNFRGRVADLRAAMNAILGQARSLAEAFTVARTALEDDDKAVA